MVSQRLKRRTFAKLAASALVVLMTCASVSIALDPADGSTVDGSGFSVSFPNPGGGYSAHCSISQPGGLSYSGTQIAEDPTEVFSFQGIPAGTDYTIFGYVWSMPPTSTSSTDITVRRAAR